MRLFTAVYPSVEASDHLDLALDGVGGALAVGRPDPAAGLRWVPREQRHVTLAFHGEVPDGAVSGYVDVLRAALVPVGVFDLALAGSGWFSGRTWWVGVSGEVERLRAVAALVAGASVESGIGAATRASGRPHLTVARASVARRAPGAPGRRGRVSPEPSPWQRSSRALAVYRGPAWSVTTVRVVSSRLGAGPSGGPLHTVVAEVPLRSGELAAP
ncbi:2'-5' RNA ligase family protein [Isoptericola croceus]|uniref:2'-5' RNA ligase family protein n=1 Tax=Isoptericola croceus TaxID=3031406 RepID=UPI0023F8B7E3|nr:2'-5' RNA ligase family protein [Isoptericola croceus]